MLREAGLVTSENHGEPVVYTLGMSVLEDALLGLGRAYGCEVQSAAVPKSGRTNREILDKVTLEEVGAGQCPRLL